LGANGFFPSFQPITSLKLVADLVAFGGGKVSFCEKMGIIIVVIAKNENMNFKSIRILINF
jgi:hypothetical protein